MTVYILSYRFIHRYLVCRLKRLEARDFSHVRIVVGVNLLSYGVYGCCHTKCDHKVAFSVKIIYFMYERKSYLLRMRPAFFEIFANSRMVLEKE